MVSTLLSLQMTGPQSNAKHRPWQRTICFALRPDWKVCFACGMSYTRSGQRNVCGLQSDPSSRQEIKDLLL